MFGIGLKKPESSHNQIEALDGAFSFGGKRDNSYIRQKLVRLFSKYAVFGSNSYDRNTPSFFNSAQIEIPVLANPARERSRIVFLILRSRAGKQAKRVSVEVGL